MILSVPEHPLAWVFRAKPWLADPARVCRVYLLPLCRIACLAACNYQELLCTKGNGRAERKTPSFHLNVSIQIGKFPLPVTWLIPAFFTGGHYWQGIKGAARASRPELNQDLPGARAVLLLLGSLDVQNVVRCSQISRELLINLMNSSWGWEEFLLAALSKAWACPEGPAHLGLGWERPFEVNDTTSRTVCSLLVSWVELICRGLVWQLGNSSVRKEIFCFIFFLRT